MSSALFTPQGDAASTEPEWDWPGEDTSVHRWRRWEPLEIHRPPRGGLFVQGPVPRWLPQAIRKLDELLSLSAGWDGYDARPVRRSLVTPVLRLLAAAHGDQDGLRPDLVPTAQGGVQVEWHTRQIDLEVEFCATGEIEVYCQDRPTGEEWEGDLGSNLQRAADVLGRLS